MVVKMFYPRPRCFALLYSAVYCIWLMITPSSACTGNRAPTEMVSPQSWTLVSTDCGTVSYTLLVTDPESDALTGSFVTLVDGFSFQNTGPSPRLHCDATIISDAGISSYTLNINVDDTCTNRLNFQMTVTFIDITASTNHNDPTLSPLTVDVVRDHFETVEAPVTTLTGTDVDGDDVTSVTISANPVKRPAGVDQEYVNPQQPNYLFSFAYETTAPIGIVPTGTTSAFLLQLEGSLASVASPVTLTLDVVDSGTPPRTATVTLTVTIKERPVFTSPVDGGTLYFCEDFIGGDDIANLTYTDTDSPTGVTFSVANYDATNVPFEAVGSVLKVASGITAGTFNVDPPVASPVQYTVQLTVSDGTYDSTITVTLEVDDVNDNAPVISPSPIPEQTILESLAAGSTILELTTSDGDRDSPNNVVTLSLSGTNSGHFVFDGNVLKLATPSPLDYDVIQEYNLVVTATDGADPSEAMTATENIRIVVQAEPVIVNPAVGESPTEVPEDTAAGHAIYTFTSTDKDTDVATLVYTMGTQTPASPTPFGIVGNVLQTTAGLTADALDAEAVGAVTAYSIDVSVTDGTYTDTATLQLTITDVNDNDPVFDAASYAAAINENTAAGTSVLNVVATDDDVTAANNVITFSMTGTNSAHFAIDGSTGEITVADPSMLDYATVSSYTLDILATDSGTPARSATVTATITLESSQCTGNGAPMEMVSPQRWNLASTDCGTAYYQLLVTDPESDALTGSFVNSAPGFSIQARSTRLECDQATISAANQRNYTLGIRVDDGCASHFLSFSMTVTFTDLPASTNINDPTLSPTSVDVVRDFFEVDGGSATIYVTALTGSDADGDDVTSVKIIAANPASAPFSIVSTGTTSEFSLQIEGSLTSVASPVTLTLDVVDSGTPPRTATVILTVTIKEPPILVRPAVGEDPTEIGENKAASELVYTFISTDKDTDLAGLTYTIVAQVPATPVPFEVVGSTLVTKAGLGADVLDQDGTGPVGTYTLTIRVSDGKYTDNGEVVIKILDSNDELPVFTMPTYTSYIGEDASGIIDLVVASDGDLTSPNNVVTYTITGGNDEGLFSMDSADGAISLTDQVKLPRYQLTVTATDGGTPVNSVTANVVVNVDPNVVDECASNPCQNRATCRPNVNYYWCDCAEGWTGIACRINIDDCDPNPCYNNGMCVDDVASYTCDCQPGWGGEQCTQACTGHTYGANCAQACSCNDSHVATTTAAQSQKCNIVSGACVCTVSWTGDSCDDDAIECGQGTAVCSVANTVCQDTFGSYQCICATGYTPGSGGDCVAGTDSNESDETNMTVILIGVASGVVILLLVAVVIFLLIRYVIPRRSDNVRKKKSVEWSLAELQQDNNVVHQNRPPEQQSIDYTALDDYTRDDKSTYDSITHETGSVHDNTRPGRRAGYMYHNYQNV